MRLGMDNLAMTATCEHAERLYSGECLGSFNDVPHHSGAVLSWYWICPNCLEVGSDFFEATFRPRTDPTSYWKKMRERDPGCFVPQSYR